ncbi:MAG: hypothetical protein CMN30_00165 [Sandaracinus sp.]|nr:hypothetical protein [Sandaracinus sp.]|tara:strand:+ start:1943 stop:3961 length:2019 start_codon:yes stop_codon:yes gene_type:complete
MRNIAFSERYQSLGKLHAGPGVAFYEGVDHEANQHVTLLVAEGETSLSHRVLMARRAQVLGAMTHRGFLRLLADESGAARPFLVLEKLVGRPFETWAGEHRARAATAKQILRELASALEALHATGHLHGELAPHDLWVRGLGKHVAPTLVGLGRCLPMTPDAFAVEEAEPPPDPYLAPELFAGERPTVRTDLYAIGAVVYRYLTGRPPIDLGTDTAADTAAARIRTQRPEMSLVPRAFRGILERLLAKSPSERFGSATELKRAIDAWREEPGIGGLGPGDAIGQYVIQTALGEGGFGVTVLARDETLQRDVAIKVLHRGDAEDLLTEARAMARVSHPNVATIYGYGKHEGNAYLVMQYLPGEPLSRMLETADEPLGTTELITILDATAMGVEAIHEVGLVHGDLKPDNIVVGPAFRIGVTDFGLVQAVDHFAEVTSRIEGTPAYLAPERIRGRVLPSLAHRIDVYALGILAYELVTGVPPFQDSDRALVMQRHLHAPVTAPSAIAGRLEALDPVILRALQKDPKRRTPDVATFRRELREALASEDEDALPGLRILLVDPDREERTAVVQLIERLVPGAHVAQAAIGSAALKRATRRRPDLLLLELTMPDMNGVELLAELRSALDDPPPVVVLTRAGSAADWPLLRGLGARAFMPKPVDDEIFALVVERLLGR